MKLRLETCQSGCLFFVFCAVLVSGCCGPCFAPCNPFKGRSEAKSPEKAVSAPAELRVRSDEPGPS